MIVIKRRLIFWLLKAYLKKWGKIILLCFLLGLGIFFLLRSSLPYIIAAFTGVSKETDGVVGTYSLETLPPSIIKEVSRGLTKIDDAGNVSGDLATSWEIKDDGKTYVLHLKKGLQFDDGTPFTSKEINNSFANVSISRPDDSTIVYKLNDTYSPFLVAISRPIFREGLVGMGPYRIKKAVANGNFLESLTLASSSKSPALKIYQFYPTQDALKVAFALGEINKAVNLSDMSFKTNSFTQFPRLDIAKSTNYTQLVALFYDTQNKDLSDKKLRDALSYALPNDFLEGERAYTPIPPTSWAYNVGLQRVQDITHAKLLLDASLGKDLSTFPPIVISTLPKYEKTARAIQSAWDQIGIKSKIQIAESIPPVFQVYLGNFNVPEDPDQYTLWHSYQGNNITNYRSIRIDKLLEDGRKTMDKNERIKIYADFQKYLQDDQPASFLYFPYNFTLKRM